MSRPVTRRTALRGSLAASLGLAAGAVTAHADPTLSANDRRLVAIAAELLDIDTRANALDEDAPGYDALIDRYRPLEAEMEETPADTMTGILAKVQALQIEAVRGCVNDVGESLIADLARLHATGRLAHA